MKFKLVKSNSCSSRLELAGTELASESKDNIESMKKMMHNRTNTPSPLIELNEQEESVRDMIYKLEGKNISGLTKPRIIESKCIEKIPFGNDGSIANNRNFLEPKEQQNINENEIAEQLLLDNNIKTNYTVNNHISVINAAQQHNSSEIRKGHQTKSKMVRNINVDLALPLISNANNNKPIKDRENLARKASLSPLLLKTSSKENINENTEHNEFKLTKWNSIGKLESIEMVKNQDKRNQANDTNNNNINKIPPPALKSTLNSPLSNKSTKMVNWSTIGNLDKEYIANDRRLIETKKYDEMEFEQFEVLGEHYDSLNSK